MKTTSAAEAALNLRRRAEAKSLTNFATTEQLTHEKTVQLLHELQVHQIELEMQINELRAEQDMYHSIYDNTLDAIFLSAPDGRILAANPAACSMFERSEEDLKQVGRSGIMDTSDPKLALALEERTLHGQIMVELTCIRKSGVKFPVEITSSVFRNNDGEERTSLIIRDLTIRQQAHDALRKSEQKSLAIIESSPVPLALNDNQGNIIFLNKAFVQTIATYAPSGAIFHRVT